MNSWKVIVQIAKTQMLTRRKQTITATLGVTIGIMIFIFMVSMIAGMNQAIEDIMLGNVSHVHIYKELGLDKEQVLDRHFAADFNVVHHPRPSEALSRIRNGFSIADQIRRDERVAGVSGTVNTQVFYRFGPIKINAQLEGVILENENQLFGIADKVIEGSARAMESQNNALMMGYKLAERLNVGVGDRVIATTYDAKEVTLTVVGLFKTGYVDIDKNLSMTSLSTVQRMLNKDSKYITDIKIKLHDMARAQALAATLQSRYSDYKADDWQTANASFLLSMRFRDIIFYGVVFAILAVAGFGIYNILTMMIFEKMKDIAILKATGFSGRDVRRIFLTQALTVGLIGSLLGILLGFLISYSISKVPYEDDFWTLETYPIAFSPAFYIFGMLFGLVTTALAGFFPSRKAAKVDPIEIIRG